MGLNPVAWGAIGLATGIVSGVTGQRVAAHVQNPKWVTYEQDRQRLPPDLRGRLSEPNGTVMVPSLIALGGIGMAGMMGSIIEAQERQAGGDAPSSMAFMAGGMIGAIAGANLMRAIAGDKH